MTTEREPEADAALRRELPNLRAAWRLARGRGALDDAAAMVIALFDAVAYRDLVEIRGWAEELADDPALAGAPARGRRAGHGGRGRLPPRRLPHGPTGSPAPGSSGRPTTPGRGTACRRCRWPPWPAGRYAEVVEHSLAAAALAARPRENLGIAALAAAYAGDLDAGADAERPGARRRGVADDAARGAPTSPGRSRAAAGRSELAEQHYVRAIDLARASGATFLVGVATVGLLAVRADAGRVHEALRGYREVIDYFARTGNWTHLWATLRNLADLLRRLGDDEPAALLDAAADRAPDAPAVDRSRRRPRAAGPAGADPRPGRRPRGGPAGHRAEPHSP